MIAIGAGGLDVALAWPDKPFILFVLKSLKSTLQANLNRGFPPRSNTQGAGNIHIRKCQHGIRVRR